VVNKFIILLSICRPKSDFRHYDR